MKLYVDRSLAVPLGVQLRGLIEFGIACGDLRVGERLPSVRELADQIGVAPMTVSQVYREMKAAGLIEARAGSGTFVANASSRRVISLAGNTQLHRRVEALVDDALAMGLRSSDIVSLVSNRVHMRMSRPHPARIAMVGVFPAATARYAQHMAGHFGREATVDALTIDALREDAILRARTASADLVITFAHRQRELEALLPQARVITVSFIPSEETRLALASLNPLARVCVVSRIPEFLPTLKIGVQRFAPHVAAVAASLLHSATLDQLIAGADVVVYATGSESVLERLAPDSHAIEYRHIPDPTEIERVIVPRIRAFWRQPPILERAAS